MSDTMVVVDSGLLAFARPRNDQLELHLRGLADGLALLAEVKEFLRRKAQGRGEQSRGESLDAGVVFPHRVVEETPGGGDLVFDVGQFGLQLLEIRVGL